MMRKKKVLSCLLVPLLSANLLLSGCSRTADEPATKSGFYFNTVISVQSKSKFCVMNWSSRLYSLIMSDCQERNSVTRER